MLERIRAGRFCNTLDQRYLPIGAAVAADDAAERTPFAEIARHDVDAEPAGRDAAFVEVIAVARRAAGQGGGERRRPALEIAVGAEHAVRINDDAGVAH